MCVRGCDSSKAERRVTWCVQVLRSPNLFKKNYSPQEAENAAISQGNHSVDIHIFHNAHATIAWPQQTLLQETLELERTTYYRRKICIDALGVTKDRPENTARHAHAPQYRPWGHLLIEQTVTYAGSCQHTANTHFNCLYRRWSEVLEGMAYAGVKDCSLNCRTQYIKLQQLMHAVQCSLTAVHSI